MKTKIRAGMYTARGASMRKRIAANRKRAKWAGLLYLIGVLVLTALTCLPLLTHELAPVGVSTFYKAFMPENLKGLMGDKTKLVTFVNCLLYAILLLTAVVGALKSLGRLGWLFKKRGTKAYGFNRNVYGMEDIGSYLSSTLSAIIIVGVMSSLLCGELVFNKTGLLAIGVGVVFHLLAGFIGAKVGYYDFQDGEIVEAQRLVGRGAPLLRNCMQLVAVAAVIYLINYQELSATLLTLTSMEGIQNLIADMNGLIVFAAQMVAILCLFILVKHATGMAEFHIDGPHAEGMKNFRVFSFFLCLAAGAAFAVKYLMLTPSVLDTKLLVIAAGAFCMFVIELIMRKRPKFKAFDMANQVVPEDEQEIFL